LNAAGSLKAGVPQVFYTGEVGGAEAAQWGFFERERHFQSTKLL
jgi:hypothetical protein